MREIEVAPGVRIPAEELRISFVRPGGPGGQHANTSATKVQLRFDVAASTTLSDLHKQRIFERLASRLTGDGELVLESGEHRSQVRNREAVIDRLRSLLGDALDEPAPRRPSRRPRGAIERRLQDKRIRAERKRLRRPPPEDAGS